MDNDKYSSIQMNNDYRRDFAMGDFHFLTSFKLDMVANSEIEAQEILNDPGMDIF